MPNMFTTRHRSSGYASNQGSSILASSGSPPRISSRTTRPVWSTDRRLARAEGVWLSTVTPWATMRSRNRSGSREVRWGTTTRRPPVSRQPQISHTEKSKALEWKNVHTSAAPSPKSARVARTRLSTLSWGTATPLGRPVEPDVKIT